MSAMSALDTMISLERVLPLRSLAVRTYSPCCRSLTVRMLSSVERLLMIVPSRLTVTRYGALPPVRSILSRPLSAVEQQGRSVSTVAKKSLAMRNVKMLSPAAAAIPSKTMLSAWLSLAL